MDHVIKNRLMVGLTTCPAARLLVLVSHPAAVYIYKVAGLVTAATRIFVLLSSKEMSVRRLDETKINLGIAQSEVINTVR